MAQIPEIPASAYTPEMEIFGVILDIPIFEGDRIPVSLTLLPSVRGRFSFFRHQVSIFRSDAISMRCAVFKVRPSYAVESDCHWIWRLRIGSPPAMRYALMEWWNDCTRSFIFGFGELTLTLVDYTAITEIGFDGDAVPLDTRYQTAALGAELVATLLGVTTRTRYTSQGYVSYKDLSLIGTYDWASLALVHLYHGLDVWAYEYRIYPGGPESDARTEARWIPPYLVHRHHTYFSLEDPYYWRCYLNDRALADASIKNLLSIMFPLIFTVHLADFSILQLFLTPWEGDAWTAYAPRVRAEALTWSRVLLRGYWLDRNYLGERVLEIRTITAQRRVPVAPPRHMCTLDGMTPEDILLEYGGFPADDYLELGDYNSYLSTRLRTRLPDVQEYSQDKKRHRTPAFYRTQAEADVPAGPIVIVLGDIPFPPGMEVALDPILGLGPTLAIPADLRQVPAQRYQELYQRFCFARAYIARLYPEHHEMELEIGRLRRHQTHQGAAISRLQMENDRLRTRLEVKGIPLDSSNEEEEDDDDDSSDDVPPPPPLSVRRATAGPSQRQP
ncbi:hypothetical protein JCGZ_12771 [Jatropha curcas]|uniref:Aminotransferase-like plant mobile domain-containing protein n=1 Tax=Jatropha curcas TaxID=180498 RepID=A0A067LP35_JATCU|nr:hypothetical protein JCGZ_12771 [Jatropha curcas]